MKFFLLLINYYAHDFFSAMWLASFATLYLIHVKTVDAMQTVADSVLVTDLLHLFFRLQIVSLLLIMVTGIVRYIDSKEKLRQTGEKTRRDLLIIKHILAIVIYGGGCWLGYLWAY